MKERRMRKLLLTLAAVILTGISVRSVKAAYDPLSVPVEISGQGTYVLDGNPSGEKKEINVNGKGSWTLSYTEPGTYEYRVYNKNNPEEEKQMTVFVVNDEDNETGMKASVVFEENGKKTDGSFPVPQKKAPQTGDRGMMAVIAGMIGSLAAAGMCLRIRWKNA